MLLSPVILINDFLFFFWLKVVCNLEKLSGFLNSHAFNHACKFLAAKFKKRLGLQEVCCHDELNQLLKLNINKLHVPLLLYVGKVFALDWFVIESWCFVGVNVSPVFDNLL